MRPLFVLLWAAIGLAGPTLAEPAQQSLIATLDLLSRESEAGPESKRKLQGRFLHITDLHPDPFYKLHSSTDEDDACHRGSGPAGTYGAETSDCDSPITLINATFDWIEANLKDTIDFVVWTGDSARHDNDEKIPRTEKQVLDLNQMLVDRFVDVFKKPDNVNDTDPTNDLTIPIIPTFGNNDILPHNIMTAGPNKYTKQYLRIWKKFIPEAQRHGFERGGWFFVEAIPGRLVIFSLNTLYFFDSNSAVDGCADKTQPGFEHMEWLRIQLEFVRKRGMKAILTGHVPPARTLSKMSWDETCWQKYTLWIHQFRDIVIGSIYGHMNLDHFMLQDSKDVDIEAFLSGEDETENLRTYLDSGFSMASAEDYLTDLREDWANLPALPSSTSTWPFTTQDLDSPRRERYWHKFASAFKSKKDKNRRSKWGERLEQKILKKIGGKWAERFSVSLVGPSVVPNYFPTLRVIEYNITGIDDPPILPETFASSLDEVTLQGHEIDSQVGFDVDVDISRKKKKKKHSKEPSITIPKPPSKSAPPGPAYSSQTLSWLGYVQYFANLTTINNDLHDASSFNLSLISEGSPETLANVTRWHPGKHSGKNPHKSHPKPNPKEFKYEVEYSTFNDSAFDLPDLTVRNFLRLAQRIGKYRPDKADEMPFWNNPNADILDIPATESAEEDMEFRLETKKKKHKDRHAINKAWFTFVKRAFVGAIEDEEIHERYGQEIVDDRDGCLETA